MRIGMVLMRNDVLNDSQSYVNREKRREPSSKRTFVVRDGE